MSDEFEARREGDKELIDTAANMAFENNWTDEEFASRAVGLIIRDKGNVSKYDFSIWVMLQIFRRTEELRRADKSHRYVEGEDFGTCARCGKYCADRAHAPMFPDDMKG